MTVAGETVRRRPGLLRIGPAGAQAVYYLGGGVWPLVGIRSFVAVTGPKGSPWLVRTVGVLMSVIGASLGLAAARDRVGPEQTTLGLGAALGLAAIDVAHARRRRLISRVFLLDAIVQAVLVAWWLGDVVARHGGGRGQAPGR